MYEAKCIVMDYQHHNAQLQAQTQQHLQQLQSLAPDSTRWNQYQQFWRHQMLMNGIKSLLYTGCFYIKYTFSTKLEKVSGILIRIYSIKFGILYYTIITYSAFFIQTFCKYTCIKGEFPYTPSYTY